MSNKIKTKSGFSCDVDLKGIEDDYELLELLSNLEDNPLVIVKIAKKVLGEESYTRLKEHLRKDGQISTSGMTEELTEIMQSIQQLKNS